MSVIQRVLILTLTCLQLVVASSYATEDEAGSQYLAFNGTISATVLYPTETDSKSCPQQVLGPYVQSYLYVGVNPPWDSNPFFFELYHLASELNPGFITFTDDSIYNLDFTTAAYACWADDGTPCGLIELDYHFVAEELLNLNMSKVEKVKVGQEDGYNVSGDQTSWVKNTTERGATNRVDLQSYCYDANVDWARHFTWSGATPFTYSVTFSNSTATASITTNITNSSMTLSFTGDRITNFTAGYPQLELDTSDSSMPHFRYINDSSIHFKDISGTWEAAATPFSTASPTSPTSPTSLTSPASVSQAGTTTFGPLFTNTISAGQPITTNGAGVGMVRNSWKGASTGVLILSFFDFLAI